MEAYARDGSAGSGAAWLGFSRKSLTRPSALVARMPKLDACLIGTPTADTVTSAPRSW
ncbi:hypothetical protein D3C83_309000 [compost metagenome]